MPLNYSDMENVNEIHDRALIEHFKEGIDKKVFILTPSFPYMFTGTIKRVLGDTVELDVDKTHFAQLENKTWYVHIHNIEFFYIERPGGPFIPKLDDF